MSANTTPDGITYPVGTDAIAPLHTVFAVMASTVQTALNNRTWLKALADLNALAAATGMPTGGQATIIDGSGVFQYTGTLWQQIDAGYFATTALRDTAFAKASGAYKVNTSYCSTGDAVNRGLTQWSTTANLWLGAGSGMVPIVPVSVGGTGVTLNAATGRITLAGAGGGITINGCFTSSYDNYVVRFTASGCSVDNDALLQFTVAGSATATGYTCNQPQWTSGSGVVLTSTTYIKPFRISATGGCSARLEIAAPFLARYTTTMIQSQDTISSLGGGGTLANTTSYDGFTISTSAGVNGEIRIYGFNNL